MPSFRANILQPSVGRRKMVALSSCEKFVVAHKSTHCHRNGYQFVSTGFEVFVVRTNSVLNQKLLIGEAEERGLSQMVALIVHFLTTSV